MVDLVWTAVGAAALALPFEWYHSVAWLVFIVGALEILSWLVLRVPLWVCPPRASTATSTTSTTSASGARPLLRARGAPLERFVAVDHLFCSITKVGTAVFSYHMAAFCWNSARIAWSLDSMTLLGSPLVACPLLYLLYDFFYYIFHRTLHTPKLYGYIHKHHHRQTAPHRGNKDAINIHPIEMLVGEYNHLWSLWLLTLVTPVHVSSVLIFVLFGGVIASLNHTRYDIRLPVFPQLWQVRFHDVHHWMPRTNYAQYSLFWDHVFGTFKDYPKDKDDTAVPLEHAHSH